MWQQDVKRFLTLRTLHSKQVVRDLELDSNSPWVSIRLLAAVLEKEGATRKKQQADKGDKLLNTLPPPSKTQGLAEAGLWRYSQQGPGP